MALFVVHSDLHGPPPSVRVRGWTTGRGALGASSDGSVLGTELIRESRDTEAAGPDVTGDSPALGCTGPLHPLWYSRCDAISHGLLPSAEWQMLPEKGVQGQVQVSDKLGFPFGRTMVSLNV